MRCIVLICAPHESAADWKRPVTKPEVYGTGANFAVPKPYVCGTEFAVPKTWVCGNTRRSPQHRRRPGEDPPAHLLQPGGRRGSRASPSKAVSTGCQIRRRLQSGPAGITAGRNRRNDRKGAFAPGGSSKRGPIYELAVLGLLKERNAVAQEIVGRTFRVLRLSTTLHFGRLTSPDRTSSTPSWTRLAFHTHGKMQH